MTADDVRAALLAAGVSLTEPRRVSDEMGRLLIQKFTHPLLTGRLTVSEWVDAEPSWSLLVFSTSGSIRLAQTWAPVSIWRGDIHIPTVEATLALTEVCGLLASPAGIAECARYEQEGQRGPILTRCAEWTWRDCPRPDVPLMQRLLNVAQGRGDPFAAEMPPEVARDTLLRTTRMYADEMRGQGQEAEAGALEADVLRALKGSR